MTEQDAYIIATEKEVDGLIHYIISGGASLKEALEDSGREIVKGIAEGMATTYISSEPISGETLERMRKITARHFPELEDE
jgi:hypothetical protein